MIEDFKKCTNTVFDGGMWGIGCKIGLWSVSGEDKDQVQDEALHYFMQYKEDGEYYQILGGQSPADKLMRSMQQEVDIR